MQSKYSKEARIVASGIFGGHDMAALYDCNKYNYTYKYNLQFAMAADLVLRSHETPWDDPTELPVGGRRFQTIKSTLKYVLEILPHLKIFLKRDSATQSCKQRQICQIHLSYFQSWC